MLKDIVAVKPMGEYRLYLRFEDGIEGIVDDPANPKGVIIAVDVLQQGLLVRMQLEHLQILP